VLVGCQGAGDCLRCLSPGLLMVLFDHEFGEAASYYVGTQGLAPQSATVRRLRSLIEVRNRLIPVLAAQVRPPRLTVGRQSAAAAAIAFRWTRQQVPQSCLSSPTAFTLQLAPANVLRNCLSGGSPCVQFDPCGFAPGRRGPGQQQTQGPVTCSASLGSELAPLALRLTTRPDDHHG
jgi:hypothetical protein